MRGGAPHNATQAWLLDKLPPALCLPVGAGFASAYIAVPGRKADEKGTGGSDFMPALTSYRDATARHMLS